MYTNFMENIKQYIHIFVLLALIVILVFFVQLIYFLPDVLTSIKRENIAQCLESYHNQGQPPLGACGFDFD